MVTAKITGTDRYRRTSRCAIRPAPVCETLTRAELVAGLRSGYQRARRELALPSSQPELYVLSIACTLADVAAQFGLAHGELVEIVGERMAAAIKETEHELETAGWE